MEKRLITMAVRTQSELISQFNAIVGEENASDEVLNFMTDMRDTLAENGAETIASLRQEKDELDKSWRKKYRDAFMGNREDISDEDKDPPKPRTFEDLFSVKE